MRVCVVCIARVKSCLFNSIRKHNRHLRIYTLLTDDIFRPQSPSPLSTEWIFCHFQRKTVGTRCCLLYTAITHVLRKYTIAAMGRLHFIKLHWILIFPHACSIRGSVIPVYSNPSVVVLLFMSFWRRWSLYAWLIFITIFPGPPTLAWLILVLGQTWALTGPWKVSLNLDHNTYWLLC